MSKLLGSSIKLRRRATGKYEVASVKGSLYFDERALTIVVSAMSAERRNRFVKMIRTWQDIDAVLCSTE